MILETFQNSKKKIKGGFLGIFAMYRTVFNTASSAAPQIKKCKVMHLGYNNPGQVYTMRGQALEETDEERDIGVEMSRSLKPSAQCAKAARTAQTVLSQMARAFHYRDRHIFLRLYKQYVRPIWNLHQPHGLHGMKETKQSWRRSKGGPSA